MKQDLLKRIQEITGLPARWATPIFEYDGCARTIEIFNVDPKDQLTILQKLRSEISDHIIIFHTIKETKRLYPEIK